MSHGDMWVMNIGYGYVSAVFWLLTNVAWWVALVAGHCGEPGLAMICASTAYGCAAQMEVELHCPAYQKYARWEVRELDPTAWQKRPIR